MPTTRTVVKGTKYYRAPSRLRAGGLRVGQAINLVPEPENEVDPNAVAVWTKHKPEKLGHISKELAPRYRQWVTAGSIQSVRIHAIDAAEMTVPQITITVEYVKLAAPHDSVASLLVDMPASAGVYALVNGKRNRCYIGSSINMRARVKSHFNELQKRSHHNRLLQQDYVAQGGVGFRAIVVTAAATWELLSLEESEIRARLADGQLLYNSSEDGQGSLDTLRLGGGMEERGVATRELASLWRRPSVRGNTEQTEYGRQASLATSRKQDWQPAWLLVAAVAFFLIWFAF